MIKQIRPFIIMSLSALSVSWAAWANTTPPLVLKESAPATYTVVKGDTLWDISALYLDSPWLWPRLWQINPEIDNPDLIYPGDKLTLTWRDGQPVLSLKPLVKLSPQIRKVEKESVPTVNEGLLLPYLDNDRLVAKQEVDNSLRVMGSSEGLSYLTRMEPIFIAGKQTHPQWGVYRPMADFKRGGQTVVALRLIALAELGEVSDEVSGLVVKKQLHEIRINDVVLPETELETLNLSTSFFPRPAPSELQATILGSLEGGQYSGKNQVVVIDRGTEDGLTQGSMFELYATSAKIYGDKGNYTYEAKKIGKSVELPRQNIGSLMVIRPYEAFSLALITSSRAPVDSRVLAKAPIGAEYEAIEIEAPVVAPEALAPVEDAVVIVEDMVVEVSEQVEETDIPLYDL